MRGEWIEIIAANQATADHEAASPLMRGEWIEIVLMTPTPIPSESPLMRGEWIEITMLPRKLQTPPRLPS